ncbi:MAG: HD-GYP domain-containing protein [Candidatus Velthaea sp.]
MTQSEQVALADGLLRLVNRHDPETAQHLEATATLAKRIATSMMLSDEDVFTIGLAARLHDIGKICVSSDILRKPDRLTAEEWQEVRLHPEAGAAIVAEIPQLARLAPIISSHHERPDGMGYPLRLRGPQIPLEARVVTVADCMHVMMTDRSYCKARSAYDAFCELIEHSGKQFDGDVVAATLEMFKFEQRMPQLQMRAS